MVRKICIIPARLESSRFPNKILTDINGKRMFVAVYDIALKSGIFEGVFIASHNLEVLNICKSLNIPFIQTDSKHNCGSSRVFEAAKKINIDWDIVVNLQSDQPFIPISYLNIVVNSFNTSPIATVAYLEDDSVSDEHTVKVVIDKYNTGVYFSRHSIPFNIEGKHIRRYCHLGLYAYQRDFVLNYDGSFDSYLTINESLEQLDFIYNGYRIDVGIVPHYVPEVNVPEDILIAERRKLIM